MRKFLNIFFVTLGVIFLLLLLVGFYVYVVFDFDRYINGNTFTPTKTGDTESAVTDDSDRNPLLNETQEEALETFGIDPSTIPTSITPDQEACFVERLGRARVDEIVSGDTPSIAEFLKAKDCLD